MLLCADSGGYLFKRLDKKRINIRLCGGYDSFHKRVGLCAGVVNNRTEELTRLRIGEGLRVLGTDNVRGGTELHIRRVRCPRIPAGRESSNFKRPVLDEVPRLYRYRRSVRVFGKDRLRGNDRFLEYGLGDRRIRGKCFLELREIGDGYLK